jgi:hypothetical protein
MLGYVIVTLKIQEVSLSFPLLVGSNILVSLNLRSEFIINFKMFWILIGAALVLNSQLNKIFFVHRCYGRFMFTDRYVVRSASAKMTAGTFVGERIYNFMKQKTSD